VLVQVLKIYPQFFTTSKRFKSYARFLLLTAPSIRLHISMKNFFHFFIVIVLLSSCKALKNSTKDNSASSASKQSSDNSPFLDDISVTPGAKRTMISESSDSKKTYGTALNASKKTFNEENASQVQIKYASLLDVPAEQLTNTKLLLDIDYWWGTKYCLGGSTEDCTDCSAFTQNLMREVYAINIPRTAREQYDNSEHIEKDELQQGDLVFFQISGHGISHVGVYLANNKFAHASGSSGVTISDLNDAYWKQRYKAAGRVLK
jgi:cell wall-associated NlpC family hydrolase